MTNDSGEKSKILIMAAGTGGHVYPALATAEILREQGFDVEWLGTKKGIESRLVPEANIKLNCIDVTGLRGKGKLSLALAPLKLCKALWQSIKLIKRFKPDCVLGMGGFVAGPGGLAAKLFGVPLILHEQNAVPGLTNRLLRPLAQKTLQAFEGSFANGYAQTVGNPLRTNIKPHVSTHEELRVLVVGGSLGALALNEIVPAALALMPHDQRPKVWHQTGPAHHKATLDSYLNAGIEANVVAYIDNMGEAYAWADLVICRAGALTVSELASAGMASILVPYPFAVDDHQSANARVLASVGAAILVNQKRLTPALLSQHLLELALDKSLIKNMSVAAQACATPGASNAVAQCCMEIARG